MNFTLCLIITITMLSKILGAFNVVVSYTRICLRSLDKKVGIIYHIPRTSPLRLMSACACLSVQYVNLCTEWSRWGVDTDCGCGYVRKSVINLYERARIVFGAILSDASGNQWMLCLLLSHFPPIVLSTTNEPLIFFISLDKPIIAHWNKKVRERMYVCVLTCEVCVTHTIFRFIMKSGWFDWHSIWSEVISILI